MVGSRGRAWDRRESAALQACNRAAANPLTSPGTAGFSLDQRPRPGQYGLDFGLWTRSVVASLIERKFGIRLGVTAVGELLAKLGRMMCHRTKPVHLVVDGLPAHKTRLIQDYVASTNGMLTLHFLPGYAPELNPDELVWSHMKRTGVARTPPTQRREAARQDRSPTRRSQESPKFDSVIL
jgi:transposase